MRISTLWIVLRERILWQVDLMFLTSFVWLTTKRAEFSEKSVYSLQEKNNTGSAARGRASISHWPTCATNSVIISDNRWKENFILQILKTRKRSLNRFSSEFATLISKVRKIIKQQLLIFNFLSPGTAKNITFFLSITKRSTDGDFLNSQISAHRWRKGKKTTVDLSDYDK